VSLDAVFKENIKAAMLANLAAPSNVLRSQVANAIATIAKIEIPRREWLELIPNLCTNANHENIDYKNAALQTLGYICEELSPDDINNQLKNTIILALTSNITSNPALKNSTHLAVKAFFQALPFAHQNFLVH
jgi:importin subunit beta-1